MKHFKGTLFCLLFLLFLSVIKAYAGNVDKAPTSNVPAQQPAAPSGDATDTMAVTSLSATSETFSNAVSSISSLSFPMAAADPNTGAATAAIMIEIPHGRKGVQPTLSLRYNSNIKNGWLGVGWDIPIGFIQRSTKHGVNYNANDFVHVLSGYAELVPRGDWGTNYHGSKIEGAFSKYYFNPSTGGWEATTKDGVKYYYGTTTVSRQNNVYGIFKWCLDKVQDTNGNYLTIGYWKINGEIYPDVIDYTGNGGLSPTNHIKFYYESRPDAPPMYTSNSSVTTAYRLKTIDVTANGNRVRAYKLQYSISGSTGRSILTSVQMHGTDVTLDPVGTVTGGSALPAVTFGYQIGNDRTYTFNSSGDYGPGFLLGYNLYPADVNGDGKTDIVAHNPSSGYVITMLSNGQSPDMVSTISNGIGSTTIIAYTPSSAYVNTLLPFIVQTVSSISVNEGYYGTISTTNYIYSGGLYDISDREFRGFGYVKATDPMGTTAETWFKQDDIFKGLPYDHITKDSSGNAYLRTINTFQSTSPYTSVNFPYLSGKDEYIYDGTSTYKQGTTSFTYDAYGNITRKYLYGDAAIAGDERHEYMEYNYDTANWIVSIPNHTYVLDNSSVKKAEEWFVHDSKGNLLTAKKWLNGTADPVITYAYDIYGNHTSVTDPRGYTTTIVYDGTYTYPYQATNPLGHIATTVYDQKFGKITSEADPNGNTTTYQYDVFGRLTRITNPNDGASTYGTVSYSYSNFGTPGSQKIVKYNTEQSGTANYLWEEAYFDGLARVVKTRREGPDAKVIVEETAYNNRGQVSNKSLPYFEGMEAIRWTYLAYDPIGRITTIINPDSTTVSAQYMKGRITFIDANGRQKIEEKDIYGRLVKVEEYTGAYPTATLYATTTYQYDMLGNLLKTTDALGNQIVMTYDNLGRKTSMTDPDMGYWAYSYDANGNLTSQTDAKNQIITFTYDALNRITKKDYPTGIDTVYGYDEQWSTNPMGKLTTIIDASGIEKFYYDKLGRTVKTIRSMDGIDYTTETAYDALGRTANIKYPDAEIVTYTYDTGGNLSQVTGYAAYTNYNALGQAGTLTHANGVATTYKYYNSNNRLYFINVNSPTAGLMNIAYSYDNTGNITGITDYLDSTRTQTFTYDHLHRLTQAQSQSYGTLVYSYNQIGNITSKQGITYTYGITKPHAVTQTSDGKTYAYDQNGNMTWDSERSITYNYDNLPGSINYQGVTTTFVYDGSRARVKKTAGGTTTVYIGKLYECAGTNCTKYIFAGGQRIAKKTTTATLYYHQDHLGSSSVITNASGSKVEEIYYLPFGGTLSDTNSVLTTHKFTGQELDAETGLYYYGARYYNPQLGRFISADSIIPEPNNPQAFNRYSYVLNNPLFYTDPTGEFWEYVITSIIVAAVSYFVDKQGGEVNVGVGGSVDSGGGTSGGGWNPNTGDTYYGGGGSRGGGSGSSGGQRILELYSMGYYTGIGPDNSERNGFYEYGGGYDDYWGYKGRGRGGNSGGISDGLGITNYLENRAIKNIQAGNNVAGFIDTLGIAAIDNLLPQSIYEVPLMFMGGGIKTVGKGAVSVGKKGLTEIAKKMHFKDITTKVVHSRDATEAGFKSLTVNMYKDGQYIGTMHQVINPTSNKILHRDFERLIYEGVDYRR